MLINPYRQQPLTIPGTRILQDSMGLAGYQFIDPVRPNRIWTLQYLFAHIPNRALGGIRAKFLDNKGFVSFCNQIDLEVIFRIGQPGELCYWANRNYPYFGSREFYGLCMDFDDLSDDLHDRELRLREHYPELLPSGLEIVRKYHDAGIDREELLVLLRDCDNNGMGPDVRIQTIYNRWSSIEKRTLQWEYAEHSDWGPMV